MAGGRPRLKASEVRNKNLRLSIDDQIILEDGLKILIRESRVIEHKAKYTELIRRIKEATTNKRFP